MNTLRLRLTWLYTITSGIILTLAMAGFLTLRIHETRQAQLEQFYTTWNLITLRLQSDVLIPQSFLAQTETVSQSVIHIEENGKSLLYRGSWTPPTSRQTLIRRAKALAAGQGINTLSPPVSSSSLSSSLLTVEGDHGEQYYTMVLVPSHEKGVRSLCLLTCLPPILQTLKKTILVLGGLDLAAFFCLLLLSWHFVGWSLRPVEESRKKQAEFIAAASHELRSPLAVLRSGIAAVLAAPERQTSLLHTMDGECARMSRLIDDMLLLASADAGSWDIRLQETDMDTLLIETYEAFLPLCQEKDITLHLSLPEMPLPHPLADPERIRQILFILLDNALSYTPSGKSVCICACIDGSSHPRQSSPLRKYFLRTTIKAPEYLLLQVKDQGCGIPPESRPYLFDRFYRVDKARSGKAHFGLGLSIAKELAVLHEGDITVTDNPGGGSCFSVTLPVNIDKNGST